MTAILEMYKLLRNTPLPAAADREAIAKQLLDNPHALPAELFNKLQNLDAAVAKLKTVPADAEGRKECVELIETLMPLAAYALSEDNPDRAAAIETLRPLFHEFQEIYAKQYSDNAIEELRKSGKPFNHAEIEAGQIKLNELKNFCLKNQLEKEDIKWMQEFLMTLNAKQDPTLMNTLVKGLVHYRRENMDNFQRYLEKATKDNLKSILNAGSHLDYLKEWQYVGSKLATFVIDIIEAIAYSASGQLIPLPQDDNEASNASPAVQPINGRNIPIVR
jgi:hypothetical protein